MISVIVPVYNGEAWLDDCIGSVLAQSEPRFELLLIDDGSIDSTGAICDRYAAADSRVRVVHGANRGVSASRNTGIEMARGDYLFFLDADDLIHRDALAVLLGIALQTGCEAVTGRFVRGREPIWSEPSRGYAVMDSEAVMERIMYQTSLENSVCGVLWAARLFDGIRFIEGARYEDLDLFYQLYERTPRVATCRDVLYFYRTNTGSFINNFNPARLDVLGVVDRMEAHMAEHHPALLPAARDRKMSANFNMLILTHRAGLHDEAARCWAVVRRYRRHSLLNPRVRLKNRLGVMLSYLGRRAFLAVSSLVKMA